MVNDKLIIDIGMHKGEDSIHYLKSGFSVVAVEANPILVQNAEKKFKHYIDSGKLKILNVGIADKEGVLPFYRNLRLTEWSSFDFDLGSRSNTKYEVIQVPCITTAQLIEKYGTPYYLKIDIEGNDLACILGLPQNGEIPKYISCEIGDLESVKAMYERGYRKFKVINQLNNFKAINLETERKKYYPTYQVAKNAVKIRLQKFITFKHPYGSSGPFAEKTDGPWMSYEEARDLYLGFIQHDLQTPLNPVSWFDFHATF